jgi:hypothetical protein
MDGKRGIRAFSASNPTLSEGFLRAEIFITSEGRRRKVAHP